jgi:hypothetical protein
VADAQLFIFNLGYLPRGDKSITTKDTHTVQTLDIINSHYPQATIIVMSYLGHPEGKKEYDAIQLWMAKQTTYTCIESELKFHEEAPHLLWIYPR